MMRYVVLVLDICLWIFWFSTFVKDLKKYLADKKLVKSGHMRERDFETPDNMVAFIVLHSIAFAILFIWACILWW